MPGPCGPSPSIASVQASEDALWQAVRTDLPGQVSAPIVWPRQSWSLSFRHTRLEQAYGQHEYTQHRRFITVACTIMAAVVACFFGLDPILAPPDELPTITAARAWVGLPSLMMLVVGVRLWRRATHWYPWCATFGWLYMLVQAALLCRLGEPSFQYLSYGVWQGLIAVFFLMGLPFRWAMATGAASCVAYGGAALMAGVSFESFVTYFAVDAVIVYAFCAIAVFRYERAARRQFIAQARADIAYQQQLIAQADRRRWLEVFAGFLGHELKNAMARVSSSIELASLRNQDGQATTFFERAQQSLAFMRRLLTQAVDATSLEMALTRSERTRFDLSALVAERLQALQESQPGIRFDIELTPGVTLDGNEDALQQLLDKLINNAIEHGTPGLPLQVQLLAEGGRCRLSVRNLGDPLPPDHAKLFEPFYSLKGPHHQADAGNLGLGLFVAQTIALHHGGTLQAEPIHDPESGLEGAAFIAAWPLSPSALDQADGTQR